MSVRSIFYSQYRSMGAQCVSNECRAFFNRGEIGSRIAYFTRPAFQGVAALRERGKKLWPGSLSGRSTSRTGQGLLAVDGALLALEEAVDGLADFLA